MTTLLNKGRVLHYVDIFLAAFAASLLYNKQHILDAHGLNALKSLAFAASVAGGKAVIEAYRKSQAPIPATVDETKLFAQFYKDNYAAPDKSSAAAASDPPPAPSA